VFLLLYSKPLINLFARKFMYTLFSKLALALLLLIFVFGEGSEARQIRPVPSLKGVEKICLGYIEDRPRQIVKYKTYLEKYLTIQGFEVVADKSLCDATLGGSIKLFGIPGVAVTSKTRVVLVDQKYKKIWCFEAETPWFGWQYLFNKVLWKDSLKDFLSLSASARNRAWDVSTALKAAIP